MLHERLRAPAEHRGVLLRPDIDSLTRTVRRNRDRLDEQNFTVAGRPVGTLRKEARAVVLQLARDTTRRFGTDVSEPDPNAPLVMTGHQPAFYHPGVWFKNHLADRLARRLSGVSVNMVLDSDLPGQLGLTVPVPTGNGVRVESIDYARVHPGRTWEEHVPDDSWDVTGFVEKVKGVLPVRYEESLFADFAGGLLSARAEATNVADLVTRARHMLERNARMHNLEVSASDICSTRAFFLFVLDVLCDVERFREVYNASLALYRKTHRVRGSANPLPDLARGETPFWAYRKGGLRRPLELRPVGDGVALLVEGEAFVVIDGGDLADMREGRQAAFDRTADRLLKETGDVRIRTRALTTTIFLRLFVADVFIHGIGGAHYDRITDAIIREYFRVEPPGFITASATMHLPFRLSDASADEVGRLKRLLRDLVHNPDRHLDEAVTSQDRVRKVLARKRDLIARPRGGTRRERREVFDAIHAVNTALQPLVVSKRRTARDELARTERDVAVNRVLASREYAFLLFGRDELLGFYEQVLGGLG